MFNARAFHQEVDKMDPKIVEEIFGTKFKRIVNAAKRSVHRGYKADAKAKKNAVARMLKFLTGVTLIGGVAGGTQVAMNRGMRAFKVQTTGTPMVRKHSDR